MSIKTNFLKISTASLVVFAAFPFFAKAACISNPVVSGDWNGDKTSEISLFSSAKAIWSLDLNNNFLWDELPSDSSFKFGSAKDIPISGDWDGDGIDTIGLFRPSTKTWYLKSANNSSSSRTTFVWGSSTDKPIVGDWDGDGKDTIGFFRPSTATFYLKNNNDAATNAYSKFIFGKTTDKPLVGDWNGDEKTEIGVSRSSNTWLLDFNGNGKLDSDAGDKTYNGFRPEFADSCSESLGPEISVGLWFTTRSGSQSSPFKITANKQYNIKNSSGIVVAKIPAGTNTYVSYDDNDKLKITGSIATTVVGSFVTFDATDNDNSTMIFDVNRPNSTFDQYRGKFRVKFTKYDDNGGGTIGDSERQLWAINIIPMEQYVWGMGEITGTGAMEYNKVMTTSFRTYGYYKLQHSTAYLNRGFIVNATPGNQLYYGYDWETSHLRIKEGAQATRGKIVTHPQSIFKSDVAITPYSSWTDGKTRSFQERWGSKNYPWCQSVSDSHGKHPTMTTSQLVAAGNHMVGLSAHGALDLATNHAWDWQRILKYYYTGINITAIY